MKNVSLTPSARPPASQQMLVSGKESQHKHVCEPGSPQRRGSRAWLLKDKRQAGTSLEDASHVRIDAVDMQVMVVENLKVGKYEQGIFKTVF